MHRVHILLVYSQLKDEGFVEEFHLNGFALLVVKYHGEGKGWLLLQLKGILDTIQEQDYLCKGSSPFIGL